VVHSETVARQQPMCQWTGWVAVMWEPQETRMQQWKSCIFCAWSVLSGYKSQHSSVGLSHRRSEFTESAVEGIRLCQEHLVCDFTCAVVQ
jgi:hypothetical protein